MRRSSVIVASLVLTGAIACSSGFRSDSPAPQVYVLRASAERVEPLPQAVSLQVLRPLPRPGFDSARIMLLRTDRRLDHFNAARWAAELPEVVEALAVESLRSTGAFASVHDANSTFSADYLLRITIRHFEADYTAGNGAPRIRVAFDCTLGRRSNREVLASFVAEGASDTGANRLNAVIGAFENAADAAFDSLAMQTVEALRSLPRP